VVKEFLNIRKIRLT